MKKSLFKPSILAITMALSSIGAAQSSAVLAQEAEATTSAVETVDVDPALWVVKDEDTTIYLFGTVHILKPGLSWFDEAVKDAFDASDELVLEVIEPDPASMQQLIMSIAVDGANPLRGKLNAEQKTTYETAMTSLGLPVSAFDTFEPWFAAINMGILPLLKAGYDVNSGAEKVLAAAAKESGKKVGQLETVEQQLGFFDNLPEASQIEYLVFTAASVDEASEQIGNMVAIWGDANTDSLAEMMNAGLTDKVLYDTLLTNRNVNWANWIENRLDTPGTVFIAVGAGHLAGDTSVQEKLADLDIETTRIDY